MGGGERVIWPVERGIILEIDGWLILPREEIYLKTIACVAIESYSLRQMAASPQFLPQAQPGRRCARDAEDSSSVATLPQHQLLACY
jgi:hypothetical protein